MSKNDDTSTVAGDEYPDHRTEEQLGLDQASVQRQVQFLESQVEQERNEQIVDQIRARQLRAPRRYALPFDRYPVTDSAGETTYVLCASGQIVVRVESSDEYSDEPGAVAPPPDVREEVRKLGYRSEGDAGQWRDPRTEVFWAPKEPEQLAADCRTLRRSGIEVAPNMIVPLGHVIKGNDLPSATAGPGNYPPPKIHAAASADVRVAVIDTGITPEDRTDDWLDAITRQPDNTDPLDVLPDDGQGHGDGRVDWFAGHGSFAAGVVQRVAPFCEIVAYRFTRSDGLGTEKDVAEAMIRAAEEGDRDGVRLIISASLGSPGINGVPPLALRDAVQLIASRYPDVLIVASAGNMATTEPMYPAALDTVTAVGALTNDLQPAPFSSHGDWVDCSTIGVGVVSTFVAGRMPPEEDPHVPDFVFPPNAWAVWSGTSFAAPQISGRVARACQDNPGLTPRAALEALLAGLPEIPGYGKILRVLPGTPS
jgi:thermitase